MKILEQRDNWIEAVIADHWIQAKVFDEPSRYGINGGRISKLFIARNNHIDQNMPFHSQMIFVYERELDLDDAPACLVQTVVDALEKLPVS